MNNDIRVPKEKVVSEFSEYKGQASSRAGETQFGDILNTVQEKIDKRSLRDLLHSPADQAETAIDNMNSAQAFELVKETVKKLVKEKG